MSPLLVIYYLSPVTVVGYYENFGDLVDLVNWNELAIVSHAHADTRFSVTPFSPVYIACWVQDLLFVTFIYQQIYAITDHVSIRLKGHLHLVKISGT